MTPEVEIGNRDAAATGRAAAPGDVHRVLVLSSDEVTDDAFVDDLARRGGGRPLALWLVTPAIVGSPLKLGAGEVDEANEAARGRLERSIQKLRGRGLEASGNVGDADPHLALMDALRTFPADEVVIATHPTERSTWLEKDLIERARREVRQPITHVVLEPDRGSVGAVEPVSPRHDRRDERTDYLPPLPGRDRLTLLVGVGGTIALGVLALICPDDRSDMLSAGCAARGLIALGAFMVTVWHGVALMTFGSSGYRGRWAGLTAQTVLWGVPAAILISLLVG